MASSKFCDNQSKSSWEGSTLSDSSVRKQMLVCTISSLFFRLLVLLTHVYAFGGGVGKEVFFLPKKEHFQKVYACGNCLAYIIIVLQHGRSCMHGVDPWYEFWILMYSWLYVGLYWMQPCGYSYFDPDAVVGCEDGTARVFDMYSRRCSQIIRWFSF